MGRQASPVQIMRISDAAAARIREIVANSPEPVLGLRVGVRKGGCAGMTYAMDYVREIDPRDEVVEDKGVKVFVEPAAVLFLLGAEMDFRTDRFSAQFVFNNPNETSACGCGESVSLTPAKAPEALGSAAG
ncbi:HesB/IscA family protein [Camelimonas abortus]|uniref:HesB/IscA family protein n=1 Tax=Camelimonas abortus TaxID=1017184 RepID=A0ABV7LGB7_9HYPH